MRSRLIVFLLLTPLLAAAPSAASAATIAVDRACYADPGQRADTVILTGSGFTPSAQYQVTLDGRPLTGGTGMTDASGNLSGTFTSPQLADGTRAHRYTLGVQEGANAPTATFQVSRLLADFTPAAGDPQTLKVRFEAFGFGLSGVKSPPIYLHYIRPGSGKVERTVRLGTGRGVCGTIQHTSRHRLFPFPARRGAWRLQFDTSKGYVRGTKTSTFLFFTVVVKVK